MNAFLPLLCASPVLLAALSILSQHTSRSIGALMTDGSMLAVALVCWCVTAYLFQSLAPLEPISDEAGPPESRRIAAEGDARQSAC